MDFQHQHISVKIVVGLIAFAVAAGYGAAVERCRILASSIDREHEHIWRHVTLWRKGCIWLFTIILLFGLFAPEIFPKAKPRSVSQSESQADSLASLSA